MEIDNHERHEKNERHEKILYQEERYAIQGAVAVKVLLPEHEAQVINYLKATGMRLSLLINFGCYPKATIKHLIL